MTPLTLVAAVLCGGVGALARYLITVATPLPRGVLLVNAAGSLLGGAVAGAPTDPGISLVLLSGLAGGITTFSTLSVETVELWRDDRRGTAAASLIANLTVGIAAAGIGMLLVRAL